MPNLVGIGNTQVPTNAMLGRLAYQDSVGNIDIEKIKARIEDTATDVFVYDTSKDSDGGAWRHRTQDTSWYNEGASATRGARKEFPAVAVIVCIASGLKIYDGDDPNLPLWMEWTTTNGTYMLRGPTNGRIAAMNGIIALSNASTYGGMVAIYFISDTSRSYRQLGSSNSSEGHFVGNGIAARNDFSANCYSNTSGGHSLGLSLVDENSRDVAITVLPDAPTDPDTGLPIPTIALATIGGTSIIKDDGTAVSIVYTSGPSTAYVDFRKSDNAIVMSMNSNGSYVHVIYDIPASSVTGSHPYQKEGIDDEFYRTGSSQDWNQEVWIYAASPYGGDTVRIVNNVISGNGGINVLSPSRTASATDTMVARITSLFNSGYMHGDIKGAYLADTDDTNLTTTNLVTNGDFSNGSTAWNLHGLTVNTSGNNMVMTSTNGNQRISQAITVEAGKRYHFILTSSGNRSHYVSTNTVSSGSLTNQNNSFFTVPAGTTTVYVVLYVIGTGNSATFDDIIVTKADADHSSNSRGLRVSGTVNKSPVATGAELVGYNFPSASDYLTYPYDTDIVDVGTGDFSVMGWFYNTPRGVNFIDIASAASPRFFVSQKYNSDNFWFYINTSSGAHGWTTGGSGIELKPYWQFIAVKRVGTTFSYSLNGKDFVSQTNNAWGGSISGGTPFITVGQIYTHNSDHFGTTGQMALWKFSHTAPSIEQIKKMYFEERKLFAKNAKCTLHGTSDAVTALAFDDTKDILHVGTSAGRSEFQGLNRINNTTTAVTKAISASNGLIAEQ